MNHVQIEPSRTSRESVRNTWWGPIPAPSAPLPHDTFTANMHSRPFGSDPTHGQPVMSPETPLITSSQRASMSSTALPHHPPPDSHVVVNEPSAFIHDNTPAAACTFPTAMSHIDLSSGPSSQNHLDPVAAALTTDENGRPAYAHHGRSRSLPYQTLSIDGLFVDPSPTMTTSRSTTDTPTLHDQGQSLLLTQKFSPPMLRSTLNPFDDNASMDSDDDIHTHQPSSTTPPSNTSCSATDTKEEDRQAIIKDLASIAFANAGASRGRFSPPPHPLSTSQSAKLANTKPNRNLRSPPPVPPQSTKPTTRPRASQPVSQQVGDPAASPSLKRSKSLGESKCPSFMSQGAYLLATSSSSSNVAFPSQPAGDTSRLFRHRSAHAIPHKSND
ncbi:hypothetical protein DM01DRAFT_1022230 [Hesseltinella vesiculosa]|uniref:Uncharacterized protein n=1 Tax=Hesseltinella vesiculosa TaxID=101127 RepID=A0A1X2GJP4_9FUNG|nr:hypothetical protein DM01DRAFT_1022230 [Hesseltinella vesiculosa]